ncbi:hypothetical protein [Halococcus sediminicola]|uniref:hypothetical protein n=1 Tax=Halococcus sediminicola TaxID=1264579 RepID=UPI000679354F|nr:hypothetical protein [Halococcus sediminicola]
MNEENEHWERHVIRSVEEFRTGAVYEVPSLRRTGSRAWEVHEVSNRGLTFSKVGGSSGAELGWDDKPGASTDDDQPRTLREPVVDGEVVEIEPP